MKAVGVHVFAGGFTMGVQRECDVITQLETHDFGGETARQFVPFLNAERWEDWPVIECEMVYGNPRCTSFSCITAGYDACTHGPWAKQTQDVHDLCAYGVKVAAPVIVWESVQQAFTVGRPLLDRLRDEVFVPAGYRIAHLFLNAASFGNAQRRRRYFFVAYSNDLRFNVEPPDLQPRATTVRDVLQHFTARNVRPAEFNRCDEYDGDCYVKLNLDESSVVPHLSQGVSLNSFAREHEDLLEVVSPRYYETWMCRESGMPFSMHCIRRIRWNACSPTLWGACHRLIHPLFDRPLTVRELSALMGWRILPRGLKPAAQIAKGVVPAIGTWLAQQVRLCLDEAWGRDDWQATYNSRNGCWEGEYLRRDETEKTFNLTRYEPPYDEEVRDDDRRDVDVSPAHDAYGVPGERQSPRDHA